MPRLEIVDEDSVLDTSNVNESNDGRKVYNKELHTGSLNPVSAPAEIPEEVDLFILHVEAANLIPLKPGDRLIVKDIRANRLTVERVARKAIVRSGDAEVDLASGIVKYLDKVTRLTGLEWDLIRVLSQRADSICSKEFLCKAAWGHRGLYGRVEGKSINTLRVSIQRLRDKFPTMWIETVSGIGYILISNSNKAYWEGNKFKKARWENRVRGRRPYEIEWVSESDEREEGG